MFYKIYVGDCLVKTKHIKDETIALTVTSPPYFNAKRYHDIEGNLGKNTDYQEYQANVRNIIKELFRITKPGGFVAWNTSPIMHNKQRVPIPYHTNNIFEEEGFEFKTDIQWLKPDGAAVLRCGGWVRSGYRPGAWHPNNVTEYVNVYMKPGEKEKGFWYPLTHYYAELPPDIYTNVWKIHPDTQTRWHEAPFPVELAKRLILLYTYKGETVFDPFLGSGSVITAAREVERNAIGIELSKEYAELAKEKIGFSQTSLLDTHTYEMIY
jgi:modification methylase